MTDRKGVAPKTVPATRQTSAMNFFILCKTNCKTDLVSSPGRDCQTAEFHYHENMESAQTGEAALIRLIERTVSSRGQVKLGIGDDACVLKDGTVITTDAYAEGVHFDSDYMTFRQIGTRCACAAISDVVAMGAAPQVVLVALAMAGKMHNVQVRALYHGIEDVCSELSCEVGGGDIILADKLLLALTVTGKAKQPKLRSRARAGDHLYVTGHLGSAEAGRLALKHSLSRRHYSRLVQRHLKPLPRLAVVKKLFRKIRGLIDTSDGLATDAHHLAQESKVRIVLEPESFPILPQTLELCALLRTDPLHFALCSGEDYELLFTSIDLIPKNVKGIPVTRIGQVEAGAGLYLKRQGRTTKVRTHGYDHLCTT